ncbi:MAG: transmembrane 220 family protein [Hymenobacteraceae bacterium]|nr:transmembrane 220 family protein [Hymenobacteraceae bacterium]
MVLKKVLAILFGFAFLSFVVMQYNDPDPLVWMAIYAFAALLCFAAALNKASHTLLMVVAVLCVAGGIYMWPARYEGVSIGGGDIKNIEEAREALGLFLCALAFTGFILLDRYHAHARKMAALRQKAKWANL